MGGYIFGNPNFTHPDQLAGLIINEVTGLSRTDLLGLSEVFGGKADLIFVNPNGISCSGCGFYNTSHVTLSTGFPQFYPDGRFSGFMVKGGEILIGSSGLNARNVDYFDIISQSFKLEGQLSAKALSVYTGLNKLSLEKGGKTYQIEKLSSDLKRAAVIAIDSSVLGGMYADRIRLISTEAGVGVRLMGDIASSVDELYIDSSGYLKLKSSYSAGSSEFKARSIDLTGKHYAQSGFKLKAFGDLTLNQALLGSKGEVVLISSDRSVFKDSLLVSGLRSDLTLTGTASLWIYSFGDLLSEKTRLYASGSVSLLRCYR